MSDKKEKNIIIFYSKFGGGHYSAAKALKVTIEEKYDYNVHLIDGFEYAAPILNKISVNFHKVISIHIPKLWGTFYKSANTKNSFIEAGFKQVLKLYKTRLYKLIKELNPEQIICTHPFPGIMCSNLIKKGKINIPISNVITDFEVHGFWYILPQHLKNFFVSTESMKRELINVGVKEEIIHITGIPINPKFDEKITKEEIQKTYDEFNIPEGKKIITFFAGGALGVGSKLNIKLLNSITSKLTNYHFVCISGKNDNLYNLFSENIKKENINNVSLIKYTKNVFNLLKITDIVFTKPGGLTVTELLSLGIPIFMINPLPGQEFANKEYIENIEAGLVVTEENLEEIIEKIKNDQEYISKLSKNAKENGFTNASYNIIKKIIENN